MQQKERADEAQYAGINVDFSALCIVSYFYQPFVCHQHLDRDISTILFLFLACQWYGWAIPVPSQEHRASLQAQGEAYMFCGHFFSHPIITYAPSLISWIALQ